MTRTFSDGHPKVLPACNFLSQYYFYNIFLQKSCRFSLQTLTKFEAAKTGSGVGFLRLTAVWLPELSIPAAGQKDRRLWGREWGERECRGAFHSTKNSGNSGLGSEWNSHFPEFHSEILGVPREVGLKFRKIGITGKFRSIRPFLLGLVSPSLEINMADPQASKHNTVPRSDKRLKYLTATLLQWISLTSFSE